MADQVQGGLLSPFLRRQRLQAARPYLQGAVLDFGCGTGALAPWCDQASYVGVDRDADSIRLAKAAQPNHRFLQELPEQGAFNTIVALAVIEHIKQPEALLAALKARLATNGQIVLTTPHPAFEWAHELGAKLGFFSGDAAEEHETLIDKAAMAKLAEAAGLRLLAARRFLFGVNQLFVLRAA